METNDWKRIWNSRTPSEEYKDPLEKLIRMDGFDSGAGFIATQDWRDYTSYITKELALEKDDSLFELGCGSGAFVFPFFEQGHQVGGCDYSEALVGKANEAMPSMSFQVAEALSIDSNDQYDYVLSNAVFYYFPNLDYAEKVFEKMLEKAKKGIAILEVPNRELIEESESKRRGMLGVEEYERKYEGLNHLYYYKSWFQDKAKQKGYEAIISDQKINNYGNNKFRFNVVIKK